MPIEFCPACRDARQPRNASLLTVPSLECACLSGFTDAPGCIPTCVWPHTYI